MKEEELNENVKRLSKIEQYAERQEAMHDFCDTNNINKALVFPTVAYIRREGIWACSK